ncbi:MHS family MFS transporter [Kosakonia sp. S58]|uniref:MFS transporter n=1 Tax=unclassified Kosakonia TaxID=2632876 RepID=UPI0019062B82|nr:MULTISPECIES: MFS transporter [unclassified Kosakonia]MBK0080859.1 MHS family MFS transporter [Kosakonia sp. S57]MBK0088677.1 MHS family MFS transporter [Kosakonia sp. S58]
MQATATTFDNEQENPPVNSRKKVVVASLIGTAIEFFDFYIYATAAVIVFPHIFFPQGDTTAATLQSLATFAIAFIARPIGSAVFGHFGDRVGRKVTLVASLLTMGISTVAIGLLPGYETIGVMAPLLLALARFGQGLGLGGEWGGAALLATENAPPRKRALYGSFPQLGAPIGFFFANGTFLLLSWLLTDEQFMQWGWRVPFIFSAVLVLIGLYVRVSLHETPVFAKVAAAKKQVKIPLGTLLTKHVRVTALGTFIMLATYTLFYIMTVYSMTFSTSPQGLGMPRNEVLWMLMMAVIGFGVMVPIAGLLADAYGRRKSMIVITTLIILFALFVFPPLLGSGSPALVMTYLLIGLSLMGLTFGPMGALLPELFPTEVRYTGASFSYNVSSILGASVAPYIATWLQANYGLMYVGFYLAAMAGLTLIALLLTHETKHQSL